MIILIGFVLLFLVGIYSSFSSFRVSGTSMEPTLRDGSNILISKVSYIFSEPKRGDVVLVKHEDKTWVKRVIAIPGQLIEIKDGIVSLNGEKLDESYVKNSYTFASQSVLLGDNEYYLMGDNREPNQSIDSRIWGPVTEKEIIGKIIGYFENGYKVLENPYSEER